jgi:hypothetical protein
MLSQLQKTQTLYQADKSQGLLSALSLVALSLAG